MITRKVLAILVAAGLVPALVTGAALGVVVAVAGDRLRIAFADSFEREGLE